MRSIFKRDILIPAAAIAAAGLLLTLPYFPVSSSRIDTAEKKEFSRFVSLSPSLSKMALDLGIEQRIAGITSYDTAMKGRAAVIGTLINPNIEAIIALNPDAVFYCEEDSAVQHVEQLASAGIAPISFPRIMDFSDACSAFVRFGTHAGSRDAAEKKAAIYMQEYAARKISRSRPVVLFLISSQPLIAASRASFIGSLIADAGGINPASGDMNPYPIMSREFAVRANPDIIITAAPGGADEIRDLFRQFPDISCIKHSAVFTVDPDKVCLYDPADMLDTEKKITEIIAHWSSRK